MLMSRFTVCIATVLAVVAGCGEESSEPKLAAPADVVYRSELKQVGLSAPPGVVVGGMRGNAAQEEATKSPALPEQAPAPPATNAPSRKIVYNAEIVLVVEDLAATEAGVNRLAKQANAYISEQEIRGASGMQRSGRWKVRVPIAAFEGFIAQVTKLGIAERNALTSEDVTDRFYDTETRVRSKKVEETRLLKLLEDRTGKLEDVLKVETELSRVRSEIERLQGSLNLLANLTALTTVTINAQERKNYVPPAAPTFGNKVRMTFSDSVDALIRSSEAVALFAVRITPWLPLLFVVGVIVWIVLRSGISRSGWPRRESRSA
jgi:hypothetical protein